MTPAVLSTPIAKGAIRLNRSTSPPKSSPSSSTHLDYLSPIAPAMFPALLFRESTTDAKPTTVTLHVGNAIHAIP